MDTRPRNPDGSLKSFDADPRKLAAEIMAPVVGNQKDPLALPETSNTMEFQRAVRRREKHQRETIVRVAR